MGAYYAGSNPSPQSNHRMRVKRAVALLALAGMVYQNAVFANPNCAAPTGGFVGTSTGNFGTPNIFTGTVGSIWVPDNSVYEHNDPAQPYTLGGHNWVFDQGSTLCKVADVGANGVTTAWSIPPVSSTDCILLPVIKGGRVVNIGDLPGQGAVVTPTCDPTLLVGYIDPNDPTQTPSNGSRNTYANQLGCSISHGRATTAATANSYMFLAGIKGGLFVVPLVNNPNPAVGSPAGKAPAGVDYYSAIPEGQKLTNAAVSLDGQFALATSSRQLQTIFACYNPLGNPGDPKTPINPNFIVPPASTVQCMGIGNNNLRQDLTTAFGPDNQPYFGGQRTVNTFDNVPGGSFASAWPQCIANGTGGASIATAFANKSGGHCGNAFPNNLFLQALVTQPTSIITHGSYMYTSPIGGIVIQVKAFTDPTNQNLTTYGSPKVYATGLPLVTGLGVAEDLDSLIVYSDPSGIGAAGQEIVNRFPLCEP
jgi:hypothetical protein